MASVWCHCPAVWCAVSRLLAKPKRLSAFLWLTLISILVLTLYNYPSIRQNYYLIANEYTNYDMFDNKYFRFGSPPKDSVIKIAVTSCGDSTIRSQTFVMIKSMLMFTKVNIHFVIFVDNNQMAYADELFEWPDHILKRISFEIFMTDFPNVSDPSYFHRVFKPCASQRLFYPLILPDYDSVIHVDSDVIFLAPVEELWHQFTMMNASQEIAMAPDDMNPNTSWYVRKAQIPVPTRYSLNTGVILMNLTRMRSNNFFDELEPIVRQYESRIFWFVNDFMSIYLSRHPDRYLNVSCRWNYLTDHCAAGQLCPEADTRGVALLHGSRQTFLLADREPAFRAIYTVFANYRFNTDLNNELLRPLKRVLSQTKDTECAKLINIFTDHIKC